MIQYCFTIRFTASIYLVIGFSVLLEIILFGFGSSDFYRTTDVECLTGPLEIVAVVLVEDSASRRLHYGFIESAEGDGIHYLTACSTL